MRIDPLLRLREISSQKRHAAALDSERDQLIRWALAPPWNYSQQKVAQAIDLSKTRVREIGRRP
jgi:hypothetical protein